MKRESEYLTLAELAEGSGVPGRTIRFYIARGLLPGPLKGGRTAVYGPEHRARLGEIQRLQQQGLTLSEIGGRLPGRSKAGVPEPTVWSEYRLAEDLVVRVRAGTSPWRQRQIRNWLAQLPADVAAEDRTPNE